mmetsp:Transcript_29413/g.80407  ORF Transcript_29413/g.80407 Transcript_29413/m.80407 type:complete len:355 (-) Transcript_29413:75-1139(-)
MDAEATWRKTFAGAMLRSRPQLRWTRPLWLQRRVVAPRLGLGLLGGVVLLLFSSSCPQGVDFSVSNGGHWRSASRCTPTSRPSCSPDMVRAKPLPQGRRPLGVQQFVPNVQAVAEAEAPADELAEREGRYFLELEPEELEALERKFPSLDVTAPGLRLLSSDPPVFLMEGLLNDAECEAFVESMRDKDGNFPEQLGQSNLPALPSWLNSVKALVKGVPVLDWLGNPTVRWTYKSRVLLSRLLKQTRERFSLDLESGAANIKHYRQDQWLPVHIDYNHATLMAYLTDVPDGGHTLFPTLGFKVKPKKGSALVWPNQPPLKHAGDRVGPRGDKWILFYNWPAEQNWEYSDNFEFNE